MVSARAAIVGGLATLSLASLPAAVASRSATVAVPMPSPANVTVARLTLQGPSGAATAPRLALANARSAGRVAVVVASVARASGTSRFTATVVAIRPMTQSARPAGPSSLAVQVPASFRVVSNQSAKDVLYVNPPPTFARQPSGAASLLAGKLPGKLAAGRLAEDAQLLAYDRAIPLADMELLGLPFVTFQAPAGRARLPVTIGLSHLSQVNAVELRFPGGVTVARAAGPEGTSTVLARGALQLVASTAFFQEGLPYAFTVELSRALRHGEAVEVRASTHYFESALPFSERFVLP